MALCPITQMTVLSTGLPAGQWRCTGSLSVTSWLLTAFQGGRDCAALWDLEEDRCAKLLVLLLFLVWISKEAEVTCCKVSAFTQVEVHRDLFVDQMSSRKASATNQGNGLSNSNRERGHLELAELGPLLEEKGDQGPSSSANVSHSPPMCTQAPGAWAAVRSLHTKPILQLFLPITCFTTDHCCWRWAEHLNEMCPCTQQSYNWIHSRLLSLSTLSLWINPEFSPLSH